MTARVRVTESLDIDLDAGRWACNRCGHDLGRRCATLHGQTPTLRCQLVEMKLQGAAKPT